MTTVTLGEIKKNSPCPAGWRTLCRALPTPIQEDTPVTIGFIAESNGVLDALWCLRAVPFSPELKAKCVELANFISDHENQTISEAVQRQCSYAQVRTLALWLSADLFQAAAVTVTNCYTLKEKIIELFSYTIITNHPKLGEIK
jgi:hypothetical protein